MRMAMFWGLAMAAALGFGDAASAAGDGRDLLTSGQWTTIASDGVTIEARREGAALRIDFDFSRGAGYGGAYLDLPIDLPENYAFNLTVRGEGPANNLELKLVDPENLNVWWVNRRGFEWPGQPTRLTNRRRHFQFAWGPSGGKPLEKLGRVELIVAANEGGRGTVWIDDFRYEPLPAERPYTGTPRVSASSGSGGAGALDALLSARGGAWSADAGDASPWLMIDFEQPRDLGGLVVTPLNREGPTPPPAAPSFVVEISADGAKWERVRGVASPGPLPLFLMLPDVQTRYLRVAFARDAAQSPGVSRLQVLDAPLGASPNAFWRARAAEAPRGIFPRTLLNEQSYWTVVGQPDDTAEALINEEGQIEVDRRGFSLEPFILHGGKLLTWADATHEQSLHEGWMPIPTVLRRHEGLELRVAALAEGTPGASALRVAYSVRNTGEHRAAGHLAVAVRPIQVLPPWQDLNLTGGWTPIRSIRADASGLLVDQGKDRKRIEATGQPGVMLSAYDAGDPVALLGRFPQSPLPAATAVECAERSASGVIHWAFDLAPGESMTQGLRVPFHTAAPMAPEAGDPAVDFARSVAAAAEQWSQLVNRVTFRLPPAAKPFHDTLRATQAYILINHDGDGFQPGSRTYNRSWMRDGSMTSAAMLELGHFELVKKFVDWYAPYQFPSGKVPCVVDARGADPVPEHDSHGQLIWLIANAHRYTQDDAIVRRHFEKVRKAVAYIQSLRAERLTDEFSASGPARQEPGKPPVPALAFRALVPESISHEGYSAKPMHSYWDTFFILRGLIDAAYLAEVAGEPGLASEWRALADDFRQSLVDSIRLVQQAHGIDYLPGCVELGDFDSTSSTILLWPVEQADRFPRSWVEATFERYWREFQTRRNSTTWEAYTPYELRHVGALVRLGRKDRAWEALDWYFAHQRPAGWRHWAEVVWREPNMPRMIGDMPHTWCGSDFLNAARAMFVYEHRDARRLVLLAGLPDVWLTDPSGVAFEGLRTEFGALSAEVKPAEGDRLVVRLEGAARPPGGFELRSPLSRPIRAATVNNCAVEPIEGGAALRLPGELPLRVELTY